MDSEGFIEKGKGIRIFHDRYEMPAETYYFILRWTWKKIDSCGWGWKPEMLSRHYNIPVRVTYAVIEMEYRNIMEAQGNDKAKWQKEKENSDEYVGKVKII